MQVSDLRPRGQVDEITVKIVKCVQDRSVKARFSSKKLRLQEFYVKDDTGEATLVLWEEDCGRVVPDDLVRIVDGYVMAEKGMTKFTTGKYGRLEVL